MPAFLKRSAKAVHLEGCELFFLLLPAHYPKAKLRPEQQPSYLNLPGRVKPEKNQGTRFTEPSSYRLYSFPKTKATIFT
jgi:hypothetical protein